MKKMRLRLILVLLGLCTVLVLSYSAYNIGTTGGYCSPPPEIRDVPPTTDPFLGSIDYNLFSPNSRYIAAKRRAGSRGCDYVKIYDCRQQKIIYTLGCVGDIFPAESQHQVVPVEWTSENTLLLQYFDHGNWKEHEVNLSGTPDFSPLKGYWRSE